MLCSWGFDMTCPHYSSHKKFIEDDGAMCEYCYEEHDLEDDEDDADQ